MSCRILIFIYRVILNYKSIQIDYNLNFVSAGSLLGSGNYAQSNCSSQSIHIRCPGLKNAEFWSQTSQLNHLNQLSKDNVFYPNKQIQSFS